MKFRIQKREKIERREKYFEKEQEIRKIALLQFSIYLLTIKEKIISEIVYYLLITYESVNYDQQ